jgi:hypothetical protein
MSEQASLSAADFHGADFHGDGSLGAVLDALAPHTGKALVIEYGGRRIRPGYHVTEVKAGSFVTLDCGGNPDQWRETILQVEDRASDDGRAFMPVAKFRAILDQVARRIALDPEARLTFEVGPPEAPMQVFDAEAIRADDEGVVLRLVARAAICKPRHRATQAAASASCCGSTAGSCG